MFLGLASLHPSRFSLLSPCAHWRYGASWGALTPVCSCHLFGRRERGRELERRERGKEGREREREREIQEDSGGAWRERERETEREKEKETDSGGQWWIFHLRRCRGLYWERDVTLSFSSPSFCSPAPRHPSQPPPWPPQHLFPSGDSDLPQEPPGLRGEHV